MSPTHRNRDAVLERKERLLGEYDDVRVHEEREVVDEDLFAELRKMCEDGYTGGGYAWVVRDPERTAPLTESMPDDIQEARAVLMILGRGGERWGLPGGGREADETYEMAAVREVREETDIGCTVDDLFLLRHLVTTSTGDREERLHTLWVFFDAVYQDGSIAIQPGELNGAAWFERPPGSLLPENELRASDFWTDFETDGDPLAEFDERE